MSNWKTTGTIDYGYNDAFLEKPISKTGFWPQDAVAWKRIISTSTIPQIIIKRRNGAVVKGTLQHNKDKTELLFTPQSAERREKL